MQANDLYQRSKWATQLTCDQRRACHLDVSNLSVRALPDLQSGSNRKDQTPTCCRPAIVDMRELYAKRFAKSKQSTPVICKECGKSSFPPTFVQRCRAACKPASLTKSREYRNQKSVESLVKTPSLSWYSTYAGLHAKLHPLQSCEYRIQKLSLIHI